MIKALIAVAVLSLCAPAVAGTSTPVTQVQVPCASRYQTLSPRGTQVALQCKDHSVHLLHLPRGNEQRVFAADQGVSSLVFSRDGRWLAVGSNNGTVEVVSTTGAGQGKRWQADSRRIDTLRFLPEGNSIVITAVDRPGQIWDISGAPTVRATLQSDFGGLTACDVSPDGTLLVTAHGDTVIRWFDTATGQKVREYPGFKLETFAVTFTPDGKHVLAGGADPQVTVLDAATAEMVRQLASGPGSYLVGIDMLGDHRRAVATYFDVAGATPTHGLIWDLQAGKSTVLKADAPITCGSVVAGKLWVCTAQAGR